MTPSCCTFVVFIWLVAACPTLQGFTTPPLLLQRLEPSSWKLGIGSATATNSMSNMPEIKMGDNLEIAPASEGWISERVTLDVSKTIYTSTMKTPKDAYIALAEKGASNAKMPKSKIFHQSVLGGCYVGYGGLVSLCIAGGLAGIGAANPGIPKMAFAALFPVNLLLIVTTGAQLFTGNSAAVAAAKWEGAYRSTMARMERHFLLVSHVVFAAFPFLDDHQD